jgi:hypothetical protein
MRNFIFLSCLLISSKSIYSQHEFSFSAFSGISKIASIHTTEDEVFSQSRISERFAPALNLSLTYSYGFGKFQLETGLGFSQLKGYQSETYVVNYFNSTDNYKVEVITERKSKNLYIPLSLHYQ